MSGRRLLDAIQFLNATKSVAGKHLAVRQRQLDLFTRTSSLTKGIQSQAEGLILSAQAAAALARRFNEPSPSEPTPKTSQPPPPPPPPPPSATSTKPEGARSPSLSPEEARKSQRQAESQIPEFGATYSGDEASNQLGVSQQQDVFYEPSQKKTPELSGLPRVKVPKEGGKDQVGIDRDINADVFHSPVSGDETASDVGERSEKEDMEKLGASIAENTAEQETSLKAIDGKKEEHYKMVESRVPSSRLGRIWQYSGLATSMAFGAVGETFRRATGSSDNGSIMFNAGNMDRLVAKLSKMRGAALKLGQMLSFQDSNMLPEPINAVLQRVQDRADYMPVSQRDKVLADNLGPNWLDLFSSFDSIPMAAASIGQVHGAVLKTGQPVAVKVQYPGVADSIDSDLSNLSILLTASRLLPRGLYLEKTIANARTELAWECDYLREAKCGNRFRELLQDDPVFVLPKIYPEASGKHVLTMERLKGIAVTKIQSFMQDQRDWIGTQIMRLCLREITEFRYMQTDPNWTNFLYNAETGRIELLDFGASREYPIDFSTKYIRTLLAASRNDRANCHDLSIQLGYLTGHESKTMVDAHVNSILTIAEPFMDSSPDLYDFNNQTITDRVRALIPVMLRERLSPPPEETYSLHRKLSGAFLLCARLGSRVPCKQLFANAISRAGETGLDIRLERK